MRELSLQELLSRAAYLSAKASWIAMSLNEEDDSDDYENALNQIGELQREAISLMEEARFKVTNRG